MIKIVSIEALKEWNLNPTEEKPIVAEWYYDYVFDEVLIKKDYALFKDVYDTMIRFTSICEKLNLRDATNRLNENLRFWYNRASKTPYPFKEYFNKILIEYHGYQL